MVDDFGFDVVVFEYAFVWGCVVVITNVLVVVAVVVSGFVVVVTCRTVVVSSALVSWSIVESTVDIVDCIVFVVVRDVGGVKQAVQLW